MKQRRVRVLLPVQQNGQVLYLLEKCDNPKFPQNLGKLRIPGGGIEFGESAVMAACRELWEEFQLHVNPQDLAYLGSDLRPEYSHEEYFVLCSHGLEPGTYAPGLPGEHPVTLVCTRLTDPLYIGPDVPALLNWAGFAVEQVLQNCPTLVEDQK